MVRINIRSYSAEDQDFSEEKPSLLTHRFTRLDPSQKGYGLGMNIAHRIAMTHQNSFEIQNRKDRTMLPAKVKLPKF